MHDFYMCWCAIMWNDWMNTLMKNGKFGIHATSSTTNGSTCGRCAPCRPTSLGHAPSTTLSVMTCSMVRLSVAAGCRRLRNSCPLHKSWTNFSLKAFRPKSRVFADSGRFAATHRIRTKNEMRLQRHSFFVRRESSWFVRLRSCVWRR